MTDETNSGSINRRRLLRNMGIAAGVGTITVPGNVAGETGSNKSYKKGRAIEESLTKTSDYLRLDADHILSVDTAQAKRDHVDKHSQRVALDFVELNNKTMSGLMTGDVQIGSASSSRIAELSEKFEPYFMLIAQGRSKATLSTDSSDDGGEDVTIQAGGCGYGKQNPHPCPDRNWSGITRNTKGGIKTFLGNHGYHETAPYAAYETDTDWTNCRPAYGCSGCKFRTQANIRRRNGNWSYQTQGPEPNPEIHGYVWPTYDWGSYVQWWHQNFC